MTESKRIEPDIVVAVCQGALSEKIKGRGELQDGDLAIRVLSLPCSSKLEVGHLLRILERGVNGVQVVGCPTDGCRFLVGSRLLEKRVQRAQQLLEEVGLPGLRVAMTREAGVGLSDLRQLARELAEQVAALGPNPMREAQP
jgi:coenzyme F420-reducing hydrogenase delta subunit